MAGGTNGKVQWSRILGDFDATKIDVGEGIMLEL